MLRIRLDPEGLKGVSRYLDALDQDIRHEVRFKAALDTAKQGRVDVSNAFRQVLTVSAKEAKARLSPKGDSNEGIAWIEVLPKAIPLKHFKVTRVKSRRTLRAEIVKGRAKKRRGLFWDPRKPAGARGVLFQRLGRNPLPIVKEGHSLTTYLQEDKPVMTGIQAALEERLVKNVNRRLDYVLKKNSGAI